MNKPLQNCLCLTLLSVLCSVAFAEERPKKPALTKPERSSISTRLVTSPQAGAGPGVTLRQAMALARKNTGGRVLSSKSFNGGKPGAQLHQIRLLVDGERVITVVVDAKGTVRRR